MPWTIAPESTRTVIKQDGVGRFAINGDGSLELLTPVANPTGNKVPTAGQLPFTKEYVSPEQTIINGGTITLLHGLGVKYKHASVWLVCKTAELGYPVGAELEMGSRQDHNTQAYGFTTRPSGTVEIVITVNSNGIYIPAGNGVGLVSSITTANWRLIVRAWA